MNKEIHSEIEASLTDRNEYCGRCGRKLVLLDLHQGNWISSCKNQACSKLCSCLDALKQGKESELCMVHWKCKCTNGDLCEYHRARPQVVVSRYTGKKDDWPVAEIFRPIVLEAQEWISIYEKQQKKALNHCGSCWADLKTAKPKDGKKTAYCPKGCACTCGTKRSCVVHWECSCLITWICEFHRSVRPDVAVAMYNALPANEPARLSLSNSFAREGIDRFKVKRLGRKPKEMNVLKIRERALKKLKDSSSITGERVRQESRPGKEISSAVVKHQQSMLFVSGTKQPEPKRSFDFAAKLSEYKRWLEEQELAEQSKRNYYSRVTSFAEFVKQSQKTLNPEAPTERHILVDELHVHLRSVLNLKPATINSYLSAIDNFFEFLGLGRLETSRQKLKSKDLSILTGKEQKKFLKAARKTRRVKDKALALLLFETGIKLSECVNLEVSDLKLSGRKKTLRVRHISGSSREFVLSEDLCEAIQDWLRERNDKYAGKNKAKILFLNPQGNRMLPNAVYESIRKVAREGGLELTPHALRDTAVRNFMKSEDNVFSVAQLAGHRSLNSTKKYLTNKRQ